MTETSSSIQLGTLFRIPIIVHHSLLTSGPFVAFWIFFAGAARGLADGFVLVAIFVASILIHELSHALTARSLGVPVRDIALTWYGGYAEFWSPPSKLRSEALIALAGPVSNLVIAGAAFLALHSFQNPPPEYTGAESYYLRFHRPDLLERSVEALAWTNLSLGVFNLLPGLPLDGGHVLRSVLGAAMSRERASWVAAWAGVVVGVATVVLAFLVRNWWTVVIGISITLSAWGYRRRLRYGV